MRLYFFFQILNMKSNADLMITNLKGYQNLLGV